MMTETVVPERDLAVLRSFARRIDQSDAGAHNNLGVLYFRRGLANEAAQSFVRALELDPKMIVAQRNLEIVYRHTGVYDRRIAELRERLRNQEEDEHRHGLEDWTRRYREAEETCRFGDAVLGFNKALELPPPPPGASASTPDTTDLLGQLASQLGTKAKELDLPVDAPLDRLNEEERLLDLLNEILEQANAQTLPAEAHSFQFRVQELRDEVQARRAQRASGREKLAAKEKEQNQDILLATARAHAQAGDLERSLLAYKRLLESAIVTRAMRERAAARAISK